MRQRPDGRWEARISYRDHDDKIVRRSFYGKTASAVRQKMRSALDRVEQDLPPTDAAVTVATWIEQWVGSILLASDRKEATKSLYRTLAVTHLSPAPFGGLSLAAVKPRNIDALLVRLRGKGLAESTVRNIYTVLRSVLEGAKRDGLIAENPTERVPRPTVSKHEARHLRPVEVRALLDAAAASRHHAALALIAGTGLRRGEALALAWTDVDLDKGVLYVRKTLSRVDGALLTTAPKTENSRRDVVLTAAVRKV